MEYVILVDTKDQQIGIAEKMLAHQQGSLHRAFSIMLYRFNAANKLEVLLQQRSSTKYHTPLIWANSCCSHPRENEPILSAAKRKLLQELNISTTLKLIGNFTYRAEFANGLIEHEYDHVLIGQYPYAVNNFNLDEVAATEWLEPDVLLKKMRLNPEQYVPWLAKVLAITQQSVDKDYPIMHL